MVLRQRINNRRLSFVLTAHLIIFSRLIMADPSPHFRDINRPRLSKCFRHGATGPFHRYKEAVAPPVLFTVQPPLPVFHVNHHRAATCT